MKFFCMKFFYWMISNKIERAGEKVCQDCQGFIRKGAKILDLGCGSGIIGQALQKFFSAKVLGVDIMDNRVVNLPFQKIDGLTLPFLDNQFDVCFIRYVLHHASKPLALFKEAKRVGRDKIIIYEDLAQGFWFKLRCHVHRTTYSMFFGTPKVEFNFKTESEWEAVFRDLGLKVVAQKRVRHNKIIYFLQNTDA